MSGQFRKRVTDTVEAFHYTGQPKSEWPDWTRDRVWPDCDSANLIVLPLPENMTAEVGDWIVRDPDGYLFPCKPDVFAATYEPVGEST